MGTLSQPRCSFRERNDPSRFTHEYRDVSDDLLQGSLQRRKAITQKQTKVDGFGAVVELALVNGQARRLSKMVSGAFLVKEILEVIFDSLLQRFHARLRAS